MDKIYVLINSGGDDVSVKVYKDKFKSAVYVMGYCYCFTDEEGCV